MSLDHAKLLTISSCSTAAAFIVVAVATSAFSDDFALDGGEAKVRVVARLRHLEQLVRTMESTWELRVLPTRPEEVPRFAEILHVRNRLREQAGASSLQPQQYIVSAERAQQMSFVAHWWRDGSKERADYFPLGDQGASPFRSVAFDGNVVRRLEWEDGRPARASVDLVETSHWQKEVRAQPWSLCFEYLGEPLSDLIEASHNVQIETAEKQHGGPDGSSGTTRVRFSHPRIAHTSFELLLDEEGKLLQRDYVDEHPLAGDVPQIRESYHIDEYSSRADDSGETIRFPTKATIHYYLGQLPNGTNVEWQTEQVTLREANINIEIPPTQFTLDFPKGIPVYDGIQGLGWTTDGKKLTTNTIIARSPEQRWSRLAWIICGNLALAVIAIVIAGVNRSRRNRRMQ